MILEDHNFRNVYTSFLKTMFIRLSIIRTNALSDFLCHIRTFNYSWISLYKRTDFPRKQRFVNIRHRRDQPPPPFWGVGWDGSGVGCSSLHICQIKPVSTRLAPTTESCVWCLCNISLKNMSYATVSALKTIDLNSHSKNKKKKKKKKERKRNY